MTQQELKSLQKQDEESFKNLVLAYQDNVFNTLIGLVNNREDAEDLSQEVFIKAYNALPKFKGESSIYTWLYRLAINEGLTHLRHLNRKKRKHFINQSVDILNIPDIVHPNMDFEQQENAKVLHAAINTLPENQIIAFQLRHFNQLKYDDIAEIMDISKAAVDSLLQRAKRNLKSKLEDYYKKHF